MAHASHWKCLDCGHCWPGKKPCPKCDGKKAERLPSVTTINNNIKLGGIDGLLYWAWGLGERGITLQEARQKAFDVGNVAHGAVEAELHGEEYDVEQLPLFGEEKAKALNCISAWREWRDQTRLEMIGSEVELTSQAHGYGGTLDIASVYSKRGIIDIKTGNAYPEHLMQLVAYGRLWDEAHPDAMVEEYHLLGLGKEDGGFHHHRWAAETLEPAWQAFKAALEIHGAAKKLKRMVG